MSQTLASAISALQTIAGNLSGIAYAPANVQDGITQVPFAISFPGDGSFEGAFAHRSKALTVIVTELHFSNQNLPEAIAKSVPYHDTFLAAIVANPTLSGTVEAVVYPITWTFGRLAWGSDANAHIGYQFKVTVKLENAF